jgi:hypothetical protein
MTMKVYMANADEGNSLIVDDKEILSTLGAKENVAIQLKELFESVANEISSTITAPSDLTLELTGSIDIKAQGDVSFLVFNANATGTASGSMKITLKTELKPYKE